MKFYVNVVVHQSDSCAPDYLKLHLLLNEAGFLQRALDGTRTERPTSGLYTREDAVLGRADIEFDLQCVLRNFPHRCSFHIDQAVDPRQALRSAPPEERFTNTTDVSQAIYANLQ